MKANQGSAQLGICMDLKLGKWAQTGNPLLAIYSSELLWKISHLMNSSDDEMKLQFKLHLASGNLES